MTITRLALLLALCAAPAFGQELSFDLTKGGVHVVATNTVIGVGAASIVLIAGLTGGPNRDVTFAGAAAIGIVALFLGGGLTAGHLLDPTPPMAWSTVITGAAGAAVGLGVMIMAFPFGATVESVMLAMSLGYLVAAALDLALPGRDSMSWKDFWLPILVAAVPGAALVAVGTIGNAFRSQGFVVLTLVYPVFALLATRAILAAAQPFAPWFDDLKPPFRAEPIIAITPSGAMVGLAATW